jgi:hypothetical protein
VIYTFPCRLPLFPSLNCFLVKYQLLSKLWEKKGRLSLFFTEVP